MLLSLVLLSMGLMMINGQDLEANYNSNNTIKGSFDQRVTSHSYPSSSSSYNSPQLHPSQVSPDSTSTSSSSSSPTPTPNPNPSPGMVSSSGSTTNSSTTPTSGRPSTFDKPPTDPTNDTNTIPSSGTQPASSSTQPASSSTQPARSTTHDKIMRPEILMGIVVGGFLGLTLVMVVGLVIYNKLRGGSSSKGLTKDSNKIESSPASPTSQSV